MNRSRLLWLIVVLGSALAAGAFVAAEAVEARPQPEATRELGWDGSRQLRVEVPAQVRYVQAPGPGKVVFTGPPRALKTVYAEGGVLGDRALRTGDRLKIVVQAPDVSAFTVQGGSRLRIEDYDQPTLSISAAGWAHVEAAGRTDLVRLKLLGFGWANVGALHTQGAEVTLAGGRNAVIAPTSWTKLSGSGSVVLLTDPESISGGLTGAGRLIRASGPRP